MINIISSDATSKSKAFSEVKREKGEDNIQWLGRTKPANDDQVLLVMVGGTNLNDFRLRTAQSHVRSDFSPSNWSHAMLLGSEAKKLGSSKVTEVSLEPLHGFGIPAPYNGVQHGVLSRYAEPERYPNIAVLKVPVQRKEVDEALRRFKMQRAVLDGVDLIVRWLAFVWGVARSANPLLDGYGIPSAAMLEIVIGAAGFDLTPGLESRSSCPEAISQAAKYWHEYYTDQDKPPLTGSYYSPHQLLDLPKSNA